MEYMMSSETTAKKWFDVWTKGDFMQLPITEDFTHTSPYGTIEGREAYLQLVIANKDKFLGHQFVVHDAMYGEGKACVRYSALKENFRLEVSEWHYIKNDLIFKIEAYYNIEGEISEERKLQVPE